MQNRAGYYRTNLSGEAAYKSYVPAVLPPSPEIKLCDSAIKILIEAEKQIAVLDGLSKRIPDIGVFISMYVRKEALISSQIEGTQATLEDILDPTAGENANLEVSDVVNYVKAMDFAVERTAELPLCNRLIKEIHAVLMQGVRGEEKSPGEFRRSQNWIGGQGASLKNARYIPPAPADMEDAMSELEKYINKTDETNYLVKAALIHYQFETIHPFLDGNGRVGRLLVILYLMQMGMLSAPSLYISYYLKKNRVEYYDRLTEVREKGNYEQWIKFFITAVYESARNAVDTIDRLTALHNKNKTIIKNMGRGGKTAGRVLEYLHASPIIEVGRTAQALGLSYNTVSNAVGRLIAAGILKQTKSAGKSRTFIYDEYVGILSDGT